MPPGCDSNKYDELNVVAQANLIAYNQIREIEEIQLLSEMAKLRMI